MTITQENFQVLIRSALNHLYNPEELRRNSLTTILGLSGQINGHLALQRILTDGIGALQPEAGKDSQVYELLYYRYVQQFSQTDVATQLNVSLRQYHRIKDRALTTLAAWLYEHHDLHFHPTGQLPLDVSTEKVGMTISPEVTLENELAHIQNQPPDTDIDFYEAFTSVPRLIQPLTDQRPVKIIWESSDIFEGRTPIRLNFPSTTLKLLLVAVINAGIVQVGSGELVCSAQQVSKTLYLTVKGPSNLRDLTGEVRGFLETVEALCKMGGGNLIVNNEANFFEIQITLPVNHPKSILVIDDNPDVLQMFQRYLTDTPYNFIGCNLPEQSLNLALNHNPVAIVMDVMMPRIDGWELLGRIRSHPQTQNIPVLVCTILAQESLAEALGASGLLRKPVTRAVFLEAIERCFNPSPNQLES